MRPENTVWLVPKKRGQADDILAMAERLGWVRADDIGEHEYEWQVPETDTIVSWEVDPDTHVEYFAVLGTDRERVAADIATTIDTLGIDDFEAHLTRSDSVTWVIPALYAVATASPVDYDRRAATLFERYMDSRDPLIRRVAILASSFTGWPELSDQVRRFLSDPDPDIRNSAEAALHDLNESS